MPAPGRDPCGFVSWAYQYLQLDSVSAPSHSTLHNWLVLREFDAPDDMPPPEVLVDDACTDSSGTARGRSRFGTLKQLLRLSESVTWTNSWRP